MALGEMTFKVKDLSERQRVAIESLLGRTVSDDEEIDISASQSPEAPLWLRKSWESARRLGVDQLSTDEIEAEIASARQARSNGRKARE